MNTEIQNSKEFSFFSLNNEEQTSDSENQEPDDSGINLLETREMTFSIALEPHEKKDNTSKETNSFSSLTIKEKAILNDLFLPISQFYVIL